MRRGYDLDRVIEGVAEIVGMKPDEIISKGKQRKTVVARSLLCYWAVSKLGLSQTELARHMKMTVSGIGYAARRGEKIARENNHQLLD